MSLLLALLAQIGPFPQSNTGPVSPLPPEIVERKRQESEAPRAPVPVPPPARPVSGALGDCLALARSEPSSGADSARAWLDSTSGTQKAEAGQCLGVALANLDQWEGAEWAFLAARSSADPASLGQRARLAAMAGNAALARGAGQSALSDFDLARADASAGKDTLLAGDIAVDRSRALVALGRLEKARDSLAEARIANPQNPQAWLLSATLSRRMDDLAMAQVQIEEAARLLPIDPEIGLEAGVIAMLAGREQSARKSWKSVIDAAPDSTAAKTARGYLAQLGNEEAPNP